MKKILVFSILVILALSFSSLASAAINLRQGSESLVRSIKDIFEPITSSFLKGFSSEYNLEYFLFFMIILAFVFVVLERIDMFKDRKGAVWIITIAVSILSTRFIAQQSFVLLVLQPYTLLGVALLSIIPFVVYFFFIESFDSGAIRKLGWALFIILYISLWYSEFDRIGELSWVYFFAAIVGGILILTDKRTHAWLLRGYVAKGLNAGVITAIAEKTKQREKLYEQLNQNLPPHMKKSIHERIDDITKEIRKISKEWQH